MIIVGLNSKVVFNNQEFLVVSIKREGLVLKNDNEEVKLSLKEFEKLL